MRKKKQMCEQRTALEFIKSQQKKGGMSQAAILLHEKQCKDFEKMDARMTNIEKKVDELDKKVDIVLEELKKQQSFKASITSFFSNKIVQAIIASIICVSAGSQMGVAVLDFFVK